MKAPKNYKRVQNWLSGVPDGHVFTSQTIAKAQNLTGPDVGNILKWQATLAPVREQTHLAKFSSEVKA